MVTFRDAVADALRGTLCSVIALNDDGARLFGRVLPPLAGPADYFNFFAPLRAQLCDAPPTYDPPDPPFSGGQCNDVYLVNYTASDSNSGPVTATVRARGPILGIRARISETGARLVELNCRNLNGSSSTCGSLSDQGQAWRLLVSLGTSGDNPTASINSITACGLDNCGDPPIVVPPPGPIDRPINITYDTSDDDIIDIDGDVTFAPAFSVGDLNVRVPFTLDLGGVTWTGNVQISPSFELNISPNVSFGGGGGTTDPVPPPTGDPGTPDDPTDDESNRVIIGVVVRSTPTSELRQTEIATVGIPTIYAPRIASVSFAIETSFTVAWTPDIPVKNRDCFIPCPAVQGAVGVAVSPERGWECSFVAVRGLPANAT